MANLCPRFILKLTVRDLETKRFDLFVSIKGIPQFRGKRSNARLSTTEQHYHNVYPLKREGLAKTPSSSPSPPSLSIICETVGSSPTPNLGGQRSIPHVARHIQPAINGGSAGQLSEGDEF